MEADDFEKAKQDYLSQLEKDRRYSIEKFDAQALYLSSGALAISLTFIKDIVPIEDAQFIYLYYIAIILFGITILVGFIAHYVSVQLSIKQYSKIQNDDYEEVNSKSIHILNIIIMSTLIVAIGFLICFVIINIHLKNHPNCY